MGEYIGRFSGETISIRSQRMLASYHASLNQAMSVLVNKPLGRHFGIYGNWELGIDTQIGVVYHALML